MDAHMTRRMMFLILMISAMATAEDAAKPSDPWNFPDFTAIQLMGSRRRPMPAKVYLSGATVRVEISSAVTNLYVTSTRKVYRLMTYPDKSQTCIVMRSEQAKLLPSPIELLQGTNVERTPAGREEFAGHPCKIEDVVVTRPDGTKVRSRVWEAQDLKGVPVKIESQMPNGKFVAEYGDIAFGTLDKTLFTPPEKCTPYEKMGRVVEDLTLE